MIDFFVFEIDILDIIITQFINHEDILVQREAAIALYHTLALSGKNKKVFENDFSFQNLLNPISTSSKILPETIQAIFSIIDLIGEEDEKAIGIFIDSGVVDIIESLQINFSSNKLVSKYGAELLDRYFDPKNNNREDFQDFSATNNRRMEF